MYSLNIVQASLNIGYVAHVRVLVYTELMYYMCKAKSLMGELSGYLLHHYRGFTLWYPLLIDKRWTLAINFLHKSREFFIEVFTFTLITTYWPRTFQKLTWHHLTSCVVIYNGSLLLQNRKLFRIRSSLEKNPAYWNKYLILENSATCV